MDNPFEAILRMMRTKEYEQRQRANTDKQIALTNIILGKSYTREQYLAGFVEKDVKK